MRYHACNRVWFPRAAWELNRGAPAPHTCNSFLEPMRVIKKLVELRQPCSKVGVRKLLFHVQIQAVRNSTRAG